ncbi:MAG: hypothetical protein ACRED3_05470 [Bradyrhizobium sp.]
MADVLSILSANYKTVGLTNPSKTPYFAVDPANYEGDWTGKYPDNKTFKISISNVTGFRAKVHYQSGGTNKYQEVLIKDNSFRVGDAKFTLMSNGKAEIKNVVTDPASGATYLDKAYATHET